MKYMITRIRMITVLQLCTDPLKFCLAQMHRYGQNAVIVLLAPTQLERLIRRACAMFALAKLDTDPLEFYLAPMHRHGQHAVIVLLAPTQLERLIRRACAAQTLATICCNDLCTDVLE